MRRKQGGGRWGPDEGPGSPLLHGHLAGEIVQGQRIGPQIPRPPREAPEPPEDHRLTERTLRACHELIWFGDAREQQVARAVIESGSVAEAAATLGVTHVRVYQVLGLTRAA